MPAIQNVTFACEEPEELASFWASALDYEIEPIPPGFTELLESAGHDPSDARAIFDPTGEGPRLFFKRMPKSSADHIPIHLDLAVPDREEAVAELIEKGATNIETKTLDLGKYQQHWTVMEDPEGNGFCVAPESG